MRTVIYVVVALAISSVAVSASAQPEVADAALRQANEHAAAGKLSAAIPKYEEALEADPGANPLAYYNLGEVYRASGDCKNAVRMFQFYASVAGTESARKDADKGIKQCGGADFPTLAVQVAPDDARVTINGFLVSNGSLSPTALPRGKYVVEVEATDHEPFRQTIQLRTDDQSLDVELTELTFHGKIRVETDVEGAKVRIFAGPSDDTKLLRETTTPMKEGVKVEEGRHFVEVTADGYERWIRNVSVIRDDETVVSVKLTRSIPEEIR